MRLALRGGDARAGLGGHGVVAGQAWEHGGAGSAPGPRRDAPVAGAARPPRTRKARGRAWGAVAVCVAVVVLQPVAAEARPLRAGETVLDRPRPEMREHGGRIGRIWVRPVVTTALAFDDNVFANDDRARSDFVLRTAPAIAAETRWRGYLASFRAVAERGAYLRQSGENYRDLEAEAFGRAQLTRRTHASATARWRRGHAPRRSAEVPASAAEPTVFRMRGGRLLLARRGDATQLSAALAARVLDYDDVAARGGGRINNDDRDHWVGELTLKERTRLNPRVDRFLRSRIDARRHPQRFDDQGYRRDSYGHRTVAGLSWRPTGLTTIEAYTGVRQRVYADARFARLLLPTAGVSVTASPTQLTSFRLAFDQEVRETSVPGASGRLVDAFSARVDHELRRDLLAALTGRYAEDDYRGQARRDVHLDAGISLTYLASRHLHARLFFEHSRRDSRGADQPTMTRNRVGLSLELRY